MSSGEGTSRSICSSLTVVRPDACRLTVRHRLLSQRAPAMLARTLLLTAGLVALPHSSAGLASPESATITSVCPSPRTAEHIFRVPRHRAAFCSGCLPPTNCTGWRAALAGELRAWAGCELSELGACADELHSTSCTRRAIAHEPDDLSAVRCSAGRHLDGHRRQAGARARRGHRDPRQPPGRRRR